MAERESKLRSMSVENVKTSTLQKIIKEYVAKGTIVMSDERLAYKRLSQYFDHLRDFGVYSNGEFTEYIFMLAPSIEIAIYMNSNSDIILVNWGIVYGF